MKTMITTLWTILLLSLAAAAVGQSGDSNRNIGVVSREDQATLAGWSAIERQAKTLEKAEQFEAALAIYTQVAVSQDETRATSSSRRMRGYYSSTAKYGMARCLIRLGREEEALVAFKRAFRWLPEEPGRLGVNGAAFENMAADYAILLAKRGRHDDAKEIYCCVLRKFNRYSITDRNNCVRYVEPIPFLVVFDPEPVGVVWEYSPENLEAALGMLRVLTGPNKELIAQVKAFRPDWFYPVMYDAARFWRSKPELLAQAEGLAKPGLEKQLVAKYKVELAEHQAFLDASDFPYVPDDRPVREGNLRRAQMECLQPDVERLKSLSTEFRIRIILLTNHCRAQLFNSSFRSGDLASKRQDIIPFG